MDILAACALTTVPSLSHRLWRSGRTITQSSCSSFNRESRLRTPLSNRSIRWSTQYGGIACYASSESYAFGCGTLYELNPTQGAYQVIHDFSGRPDGTNPDGQLTVDTTNGVLYGVTGGGGSRNCAFGCGPCITCRGSRRVTFSDSLGLAVNATCKVLCVEFALPFCKLRKTFGFAVKSVRLSPQHALMTAALLFDTVDSDHPQELQGHQDADHGPSSLRSSTPSAGASIGTPAPSTFSGTIGAGLRSRSACVI